MNRKIFTAVITLGALYVLSPYLVAVGMGAVFSVIFYPWMKRIERGRFPNSLAAGLFTLSVTLGIFLPAAFILFQGVQSGMVELKQLRASSVSSGGQGNSSNDVLDHVLISTGVEGLLGRAARIAPINPVEVTDELKEGLGSLVTRLGNTLSDFVSSLPAKVVTFSVFLFSLFYFLADELRFLHVIRHGSVFNETETQRLSHTFYGLCRSVILASLVSGGIQALTVMLVSLAVGIKHVPLVFLLVFVSSLIPVVGTFPVMLGLIAFQLGDGHGAAALVLVATTLLLVLVDHLVRPLVIRGNSNMHPLLAFISALGGLEVFGMSGIFLGPVICGMVAEVLAISQESSGASPI